MANHQTAGYHRGERAPARRRRERGQVLALSALLMPAILGFAGLVVDAGFAFAEFRKAQTVADASALAAATYLWKNPSAGCSAVSDPCGAVAYANSMGFSSANGDVITVEQGNQLSSPYDAISYSTSGDFVRVTVQRTLRSFFIGIVFQGSAAPEARGTAGIARIPVDFALLSLSPDCSTADNGLGSGQEGGIVISGSGDLMITNGDLHANCNDSNNPAVNKTDPGSTLTVEGALTTSGYCDIRLQQIDAPVACNEDTMAVPDPLAGQLPWPCSTQAAGNTSTSVATYGYCRLGTNNGSIDGNVGTVLMDPGFYSAITPSGSSNLWLKSGVYVVTGQFIANKADVSVTGSTWIGDCSQPSPDPVHNPKPSGCDGSTGGIMLFGATNEYDATRSIANPYTVTPNPCDNGANPKPDSDPIVMTGNAGFQMKALSSGPFAGLTVWMGCGSTDTVTLWGNNDSSMISGTVYAPTSLVDVGGNANWGAPSNVIANYIRVSSSGDLNLTYNHNLAYKPNGVVLVQ